MVKRTTIEKRLRFIFTMFSTSVAKEWHEAIPYIYKPHLIPLICSISLRFTTREQYTCGSVNNMHLRNGPHFNRASMPREFQAFRPHTRGHAGGQASNAWLHCVPTALWWSQATIHSVCDMWVRLGTGGIPHNGMPIAKSGIVCWISCMGATRRAGCPSRICRFWGHIGPIEMLFFCRECLMPRAQRAATKWTKQEVVSGWEELDGGWFMADYPTRVCGQMCPETMIDNQANNWIWW